MPQCDWHEMPHRGMNAAMPFPSWLPALLGLLTAVGPISTDMYLPAFPAIEAARTGSLVDASA